MSNSPLVDLERCSFLRSVSGDSVAGQETRPLGYCTSSGEPREVRFSEQRDRCLTFAHTSCPLLISALRSSRQTAWGLVERLAQGAADSCYLAEARLQVQSDQLEPVLSE